MICSSGKQTYFIRAVAKRAARVVKTSGGTRTLKPYRCRECGMWHLTSNSKRRSIHPQ